MADQTRTDEATVELQNVKLTLVNRGQEILLLVNYKDPFSPTEWQSSEWLTREQRRALTRILLDGLL